MKLRWCSLLLAALVASSAGILFAKDIENRGAKDLPPPRAPVEGPADTAADFRHPFTGIVFPAVIGEMKRREVKTFDQRGEDVSASYHGYRNGRGILIASAYSYPRPPQLADTRAVFEDAQKAILNNTPSARRLSSGAYPGGGFAAEYEFRATNFGPETLVRSKLILFGRGNWQLKYRFTYPAADAAAAEALIRQIMDAIGTSPARS